MSAATVLPPRACWLAVKGSWLRTVCNRCQMLCSRTSDTSLSHTTQPIARSTKERLWSRGAQSSTRSLFIAPPVASVPVCRVFSVASVCYRGVLEKDDVSKSPLEKQNSPASEESPSFEKENIWTIPNVLSFSRILLSPLLGYQVLCEQYLLAFGLLSIAAVSDVVDGQIARRYPSQSSVLGSVLDPLADKCLISILCITLTVQGLIPLPLAALILSRDALLITLSFYLRYTTLPTPRTWSRYWDIQRSTLQVTPTSLSKVNTLLQVMTVGLSLGAPLMDATHHPLLQTLWFVTAVTTVMSGASYIIQMKGFRILRKTRRRHKHD